MNITLTDDELAIVTAALKELYITALRDDLADKVYGVLALFT